VKKPGDYITVRVWANDGGSALRCWVLPGIILCADPPTGAVDDTGQWVTVLTNEGHKVQFVSV
jgi:hypothetical protein